MAKYINREAALKVLAEEAVFYARKFKDGEARGYMGAKASIEMIPAADVVEVVRCKDCIFKQNPKRYGELQCKILCVHMNNDDFCSYGEPKGERRSE